MAAFREKRLPVLGPAAKRILTAALRSEPA